MHGGYPGQYRAYVRQDTLLADLSRYCVMEATRIAKRPARNQDSIATVGLQAAILTR